MSNIKELIRAEIERRKVDALDKGFTFVPAALQDLLSFLDTLPDEPEKPTRGYDEAYLNEKIAKASKSWKEVDVDKFMDEVRGREKTVTDCHDLEEAKEEYLRKARRTPGHEWMTRDIEEAFKAGAEWQKAKQESTLTIEDVEKLHTFLYAVKNNKQGAFTFTRLSDEQYEEVIRRFNKTKEQ